MNILNPGNLRKELADILKMKKEDREDLDTMSIATLVTSLIKYTRQLEHELAAHKQKRKFYV